MDGRKHQEGSQKKDATTPTGVLELVLITSAIGVHEEWDVEVVDIPGAFLTTYMDNDFIMVMQVILVELMAKTEPSIYQIFVPIENGRTVLYVKL